ncbi:MAG: ABC transporter permease subunit, partial [Betaproteobacteria bacterium]
MNLLLEAWTFVLEHPARFGQALFTHVTLSAAALIAAALIAIPLGIAVADRARGALLAVNAANIGRTLPSLAVLALVMPVLGTGFAPSWFALTLLAIPPILINTCIAVREVDADVVDAARGMGMNAGEIIRKI